MSKGAMRFKNMTVGKQQGELARFRVLGGPDSGVVFVMTAPLVTLGRGQENDIILADPKASRKHVEISVQMGAATIRDLGSTHGFLVNGTKQTQLQLKTGDKVGLGETVLEFVGSVNAGATQMIVRPPEQTSRKVGTGSSGLTQFIPRPAPAAAARAGSQTFLEKNKKLFLILAILMLGAGLLPEIEKRNPKKKPFVYTPTNGSRSPDSSPILQHYDPDSAAFKNADIYFRVGMRELRARNFRRALNSFETASQIYENHPLAQVYVATTKKEMEDEAKNKFVEAKKDEEANRFTMAIAQYNYIKRLYDSDQSHDNYKKAELMIKSLDKKIKDMERVQ